MNHIHRHQHHEAAMNGLSWVITAAPFIIAGAHVAVSAMKKKKRRKHQ